MADMNERQPIEIDRDTARIVAVVVGVAGILTGVVALIVEGPLTDSLVAQIALAVGVIGLLAFVLLDPNAIRAALTGKQARYASNSVLMSVAFLAILVMAYVVLLDVQGNVDWLTADLTEDKEFSLSEQTESLLANLEEPVHVIGFYTNRQASLEGEAETWLQQYEQKSEGMLTFEFIDPESRPGEAARYEISRSGVLVFTQGERTAESTLADERSLTGALIRVVGGEPVRLYFVTGHGERSIGEFEATGMQRASDLLGRENYDVQTLNLAEVGTVPEDAALLVIAGPTTQYRSEEVEAIQAYLDGGGSAMFMLEPNAATGLRTSGVQGVAFSPDGSLLATASADDTVKLWSASSLAERATLRGHDSDVQSVAFSPDGDELATAGADGSVRVWDVSGEQLESLEGHLDVVWRVAWSPDGSRIASAGLDQAIILWDASSYEQEVVLTGQSSVLDVAFSPDGALVAGGFLDGSVRVWDVSGQQVANQRPHLGQVTSVAFSPDGQTVLSSAADGTLATLNVETGVASEHDLYPGIPISDAVYAGEDSVVLSLTDGTLRIWNASLRSEQASLQTEHTDFVWQLAVSPDGETLASAGGDGRVEIWSLADQTLTDTLQGHAAGDPLVTYLEEAWQITVNDDIVVEPESLFDELTPVSFAYDSISPITEPLVQTGLPTFFVTARSLSVPAEPPLELALAPLVLTSDRGWGETNVAGLVGFDEADIPGPVAVAVSAENSQTGARLVVFGDADFATNSALQQESFGNLDLMVNSANWLTAQEELINIQERSSTFRSFTPMPPGLTMLTVIGTMICIPVIVAGWGLGVWFSRRRRR